MTGHTNPTGTKKNPQKRFDYNDIAKGIGMLAIMWGHIRLQDWSNAFVYAWHIPLFFFLSGMVFDQRRYSNFKTFFLKKVKSLLVPYVIYSIATWVIWAAFTYISHGATENYWMPLAETFLAQGSGGFLVHNVPLWFVTCLFVSEMVYYFLAKLSKSVIALICIILSVCSYCLISYFDGWDITLLPWNLEVVCLVLPFYAMGHFTTQKWSHQQMQDYVSAHKREGGITICVLAISVLLGSQYNGSISFGHASIGNPLVTYPCGFMGTMMILVLSMLLAGTKTCKTLSGLKWFGRNSYTAMAIHNPIKGIVCVVVGAVLGCEAQDVIFNSYYSLVAMTISLICTVVMIIIINKFILRHK